MTSPNTPSTGTQQSHGEPERVYVQIPKAGPGQTYRAAKNMQHPLFMWVARLFIIALCITLPAAPALIFGMILANDPHARTEFLWIWIPMIIFIEVMAIPMAWYVAREGLGAAGVGFEQPNFEVAKTA